MLMPFILINNITTWRTLDTACRTLAFAISPLFNNVIADVRLINKSSGVHRLLYQCRTGIRDSKEIVEFKRVQECKKP